MLNSYMVIFRLFSTEIKTLLLPCLENLSQKVYLRVMCGEVKALCFFKPFCPTLPHHLKSHTCLGTILHHLQVVSIIV
jgi:hypothetical protein